MADGILSYRTIVVGGTPQQNFISNAIRRTKYTPTTFLFLFLRDQFKHFSNIFFVFIIVVQQFPGAAFIGRYTMMIPVSFIFAVSMIKEIFEDFLRAKYDKEENSRVVLLFQNSAFVNYEWEKLKVGDLVRICDGDPFPADLLFLDGSDGGVCYVETVNLDGENNLKLRRSCGFKFENERDLSNFHAEISCDHPNDAIYNFNGKLKKGRESEISLNEGNILLRGATLRNTDWIYGCVLYTGKDTKIMQNSRKTRSKISRMSREVNRQIVYMFIAFAAFTTLNWTACLVWDQWVEDAWYIPPAETAWIDHTLLYLIFAVVYSIVIPISLQVSVEIAVYFQAREISRDPHLTHIRNDGQTIQSSARTFNLNPDLGLVRYIFSDKTGTLTQNILEFRKCSVGGILLEGEAELRESLFGLEDFFLALCLCPGVMPVIDNIGNTSYHSSSPDHKTLMQVARNCGITLRARNPETATIEIYGRILSFVILAEFEFTSERKCGTVVVQDEKKKIRVFIMGADDIILNSVARDQSNLKKVTLGHVRDFAESGLRTLCLGTRTLSKLEYATFAALYREGKLSLTARKEKMTAAAQDLERNFRIIGATGVEDKLQEQVPQTIDFLLAAGIKIWLLTGDKLETALNVGYSAGLLNRLEPILILDNAVVEDMYAGMEAFRHTESGNLVITGDCLKMCWESDVLKERFIDIALQCKSVICCRTSPKQKSKIVKCVMQRLPLFVTLAIGDGANDVSMIQEADIGVGIMGVEGSQAANSADFAIGQFKHLKRLLFVYGTWNYSRIAKTIFFCHYKSVCLAAVQFAYNARCLWSGTLPVERWSRSLYNVAFTSAPTFYSGVVERPYPAPLLMEQPELYARNDWFHGKSFAACFASAVLNSLFVSELVCGVFSSSVFWRSGFTDDDSVYWSVTYASLILLVNTKHVTYTDYWTWLLAISFFLSCLAWIVVLAVLSRTWPSLPIGEDMSHAIDFVVTAPVFWALCLYIGASINVVDVAFLAINQIQGNPIFNRVTRIYARIKAPVFAFVTRRLTLF